MVLLLCFERLQINAVCQMVQLFTFLSALCWVQNNISTWRCLTWLEKHIFTYVDVIMVIFVVSYNINSALWTRLTRSACRLFDPDFVLVRPHHVGLPSHQLHRYMSYKQGAHRRKSGKTQLFLIHRYEPASKVQRKNLLTKVCNLNTSALAGKSTSRSLKSNITHTQTWWLGRLGCLYSRLAH